MICNCGCLLRTTKQRYQCTLNRTFLTKLYSFPLSMVTACRKNLFDKHSYGHSPDSLPELAQCCALIKCSPFFPRRNWKAVEQVSFKNKNQLTTLCRKFSDKMRQFQQRGQNWIPIIDSQLCKLFPSLTTRFTIDSQTNCFPNHRSTVRLHRDCTPSSYKPTPFFKYQQRRVYLLGDNTQAPACRARIFTET